MSLNAEQIKKLIGMQIENNSRRVADLSTQVASLRRHPIEGSRELKQRLVYMEKELLAQQARLAGLQDLQRAIQTAESFSADED